MNIFVYICIFLSIFICGIILTLFFRKISVSRNILLAKNGISLAGGISIAVTFLVFYCLASLALGLKINIKIILPSFIMLIFGVLDDWRELSVLTKFVVQIISTVILVLLGVKTKIVYISEPANLLVTFLWIIGITNAFNHLDVLDGLAAGLAIIICAAFSIVSFSGGGFDFVFLFLAFATLGFLICNYPPARIYMGNSGSHFFGFFLAASAISINYASLDEPVALLSPILILGFPVFDTAFLSLMRIKNGRSIFKKSDDHLVIRFIKIGYSKEKALFLMLLLCALFSICGILVRFVPNFSGIAVVFCVLAVACFVGWKMSKVSINE